MGIIWLRCFKYVIIFRHLPKLQDFGRRERIWQKNYLIHVRSGPRGPALLSPTPLCGSQCRRTGYRTGRRRAEGSSSPSPQEGTSAPLHRPCRGQRKGEGGHPKLTFTKDLLCVGPGQAMWGIWEETKLSPALQGHQSGKNLRWQQCQRVRQALTATGTLPRQFRGQNTTPSSEALGRLHGGSNLEISLECWVGS